MEFSDLIASSKFEVRKQSEEARFSFLKGGYVENLEPEGTIFSLLVSHAISFLLSLRDASTWLTSIGLLTLFFSCILFHNV